MPCYCPTGSGYLTACLADMVGDTGVVLGVEKVGSLAERGIRNIRLATPHLAGRIRIVHGNVLSGARGVAWRGPLAKNKNIELMTVESIYVGVYIVG